MPPDKPPDPLPDSSPQSSPTRATEGTHERGGEKDRKPAGPWSIAGAGMEMGFVVGALTLGGWWLDEKFGTDPWWMFTGLAVGLIGGTYNVWRAGKRFFEDS